MSSRGTCLDSTFRRKTHSCISRARQSSGRGTCPSYSMGYRGRPKGCHSSTPHSCTSAAARNRCCHCMARLGLHGRRRPCRTQDPCSTRSIPECKYSLCLCTAGTLMGLRSRESNSARSRKAATLPVRRACRVLWEAARSVRGTRRAFANGLVAARAKIVTWPSTVTAVVAKVLRQSATSARNRRRHADESEGHFGPARTIVISVHGVAPLTAVIGAGRCSDALRPWVAWLALRSRVVRVASVGCRERVRGVPNTRVGAECLEDNWGCRGNRLQSDKDNPSCPRSRCSRPREEWRAHT